MYKIDTGNILAELKEMQKRLQRAHDRRITIVRATAQFGVNEVRERIQLTGRDANGDMLLTKSPKRVGRYSAGHGKVRQEEGLRTDIIDLTISGELLNSESWTIIERDVDEYGAGFREGRMQERAEHLEEIFETEIFQLSLSEEEATTEYFNNAVNDLMNVTF